MKLMFDNIWLITIVLLITSYKLFIPKKNNESYSYTNNASIRITEMNKSIQMYNSILSRFDIIATKVSRVCHKNQDLMSLNQLEKYTNEFMILYPKCATLIDDIKMLDDDDNRFEYLIDQINQVIVDMNILLDKIEKIEYNSQDYTSSHTYFEHNISDTINTCIYFGGCNDLDSLNKRYHILAKAYHPDNNYGDKNTFQKMQDEYESLKKKYQ